MWLVAIFAAAVATEPSADASRIELAWDVPPSCPSAEAMREDIAALVRPGGVHGPVHAQGRIVAIPGGWALEIAVQGPDDASTRRIEGAECAPLARAAALIVAVAADPMGAAETREPDVVPTEPEPPPVATVTRASTPIPTMPEVARARDRRHRVGLAAHGGLAVGVVPGTTGGIEAELAWLYGRLRIAAIGSHWFARAKSEIEGAAIRGSVSGGGLRFCFAPRGGPVEIPVCTGLEASAVVATGEGDRIVEHVQRDWMLSLPVSVGLDAPVGRRFVVRTRLETLVGLRRPAFHLQSAGQPAASWSPAVVGLRLVVGAGVRLPAR